MAWLAALKIKKLKSTTLRDKQQKSETKMRHRMDNI